MALKGLGSGYGLEKKAVSKEQPLLISFLCRDIQERVRAHDRNFCCLGINYLITWCVKFVS